MLKKRGIGAKVALCIAVVIFAALGISSFLSYWQASGCLNSNVTLDLQKGVKYNAQILSEKIQLYKTDVESSAASSGINSENWEMQQQALQNSAKNYGFIRMGITDKSGNARFSDGSGANVSKQNAFATALSGITSVSNPFVSSLDNRFVILIAAPLKDSGGNTTGTVIAYCDGDMLSQLIAGMKTGSGSAFIIDTTGTFIAHTDSELVRREDNLIQDSEKDKSLSPMAKVENKMLDGDTGTALVRYQGKEQYACYTSVPGINWFLGVTRVKDEALAQVESLKWESLALCLVFIVLAVAISFLLISVMVTRPLGKAVRMIEDLSLGRLGDRLKIRSDDEVGKMAKAMNRLADTLQFRVLGPLKKIQRGDMNEKIEVMDEKDEIMPTLRDTVDTVRSITGSMREIITAADGGDLTRRCDAKSYSGDWARLAGGINALMDSVSQPVEDLRAVIKRMSVNDFTVKMQGSYCGIFGKMADEANLVQNRFVGIQETMTQISRGDFGSLAQLEKEGRLSENDNLVPAEIRMMHAIRSLIGEVRQLTCDCVSGNISQARGDVSRFEGGYREIVDGFNSTLDAVSQPIQEIIGVLRAMAVNDYTVEISQDYQGDFKVMADAVRDVQQRFGSIQNVAVRISRGDTGELENLQKIGKRSENDQILPALITMMSTIRSLIGEITQLAASAADGDLSVRGDASGFEGGYADIIVQINRFIQACDRPIQDVCNAMSEIAHSHFDFQIESAYKGEFALLTNAVNRTARQLHNIIGEISGVISQTAEGNFALERVRDYGGEFMAISSALNTILDSFNSLLGEINRASGQVAAGSTQVSTVSRDLSQGASEQAGSVEELTASVSEIAAHTRKNAENSKKAGKLAENVRKNAAAGDNQLSEMLESIQQIDRTSENISKVIKVIDSIAFQTNILALNAAVEAARAGQYGKGFAVVAQEVRSLASKSAQAAKETTGLIEENSKAVKKGSETATETAKGFTNILQGIGSVTSVINEIADASSGQAKQIEQINSSLSQVSQLVQASSASAEESAAASEQLSGQADRLNEQVSHFSLRRDNQEHAGESED